MNDRTLGDYFSGIAAKLLSNDDIQRLASTHAEVIISQNVWLLFNFPSTTFSRSSIIMYLDDHCEYPSVENIDIRWSRSNTRRANQPTERHVHGSEPLPAPGDLLIIAQCHDSSLSVMIAESDSTSERQLTWLFGFSNLNPSRFSIRSPLDTELDRIDYARYFLLERLGILVDVNCL